MGLIAKVSFFIICGFALTISAETSNASNESPTVRIGLGGVRGSNMTTRLGKNIFAFRGIKYAKPPTGELRFKQAQPIGPWSGILDASEEGPACFQILGLNMSEDCLALNIYTTKLPKGDANAKRPVIVFFHPGGFYSFTGQSYAFGPQYLLDQDIVLVTVNYRLGSLGFISTGDSRAPGNLGFKDQVLALRFVRDHIAAFGGDADSVTICGYSAGSWSVVLHMLSPMSKGLFHRAIAMSGSPTTPDLLPTAQLHLAKKQATILNCTTENVDNMFACLKEKPAEEFGKSLPKFAEFYGDPILIWSPVVEPAVPGVDSFLTAQPVDLIRAKKFHDVPLMTGVTKDEFAGVITIAIEEAKKGNDTIFQQFDKDWETIAPISFQFERGTERSKRISRELREFYFKDQPISIKNADALGLVYADAIIGFPAHRLATLMAANSREPVYYYMVAYQGRYSFSTWKDTKKPFGVVHHDDLQYLFYMSFIFPYFEKDAPEIPTVEKMTAIWAHFAKTGKPIPTDNDCLKNVTWERLTPQNKKYLEINNTLTMKSDLYADRYAAWDRIFPLTPLPQNVDY